MKACLECDGSIVGRVDKKFCDHNCRNAYHNDRNRCSRNFVQGVNRYLSKNYRILEELCTNDVHSVPRKVIKAMGFDPYFFTSIGNDPIDGLIYFLYDLSFQQKGDEIVIVFKDLENYRNTA
jgi:hypothetical protein